MNFNSDGFVNFRSIQFYTSYLLGNIISYLHPHHPFILSSYCLKPSQHKTSKYKSYPKYNIHFYNKLPDAIKSIKSFYMFKGKIKKFL